MMAKYFLLDKQSVAKTIRARRTYTQALLRLESAFPTSRQFDRMTRGAFASALLSLVPVEKGAALSTPFIDEV